MVTESEDSPEKPVAGLRGSVEIVTWRVWGGQRVLATASGVSPPGGGRTGRATQWCAPEQLRAGMAESPGPHERAG